MKVEEAGVEAKKRLRYLDYYLARLERLLAYMWILATFGDLQVMVERNM